MVRAIFCGRLIEVPEYDFDAAVAAADRSRGELERPPDGVGVTVDGVTFRAARRGGLYSHEGDIVAVGHDPAGGGNNWVSASWYDGAPPREFGVRADGRVTRVGDY